MRGSTSGGIPEPLSFTRTIPCSPAASNSVVTSSVPPLGTRFENLRIAGHPVELDIDHEIFGSKPAVDAPYTGDRGFLGRVSRQYERIRQHKDLPAELLERYNRLSSTLGAAEAVECSPRN